MLAAALWYFGWFKNYRRAKRLLAEKRFDESMEANAASTAAACMIPLAGLIDGFVITEVVILLWF